MPVVVVGTLGVTTELEISEVGAGNSAAGDVVLDAPGLRQESTFGAREHDRQAIRGLQGKASPEERLVGDAREARTPVDAARWASTTAGRMAGLVIGSRARAYPEADTSSGSASGSNSAAASVSGKLS